eukprot:Skav206056  [mRNA]  locus=scaffold587:343946:348830:+ [translate_table: standard]
MIFRNDWNILCIGIDDYIIGAEPLSFCVRQAKENFEALKETTSGKHHLLLNPTSAELRQAVHTFIETSRSCRRNLLSFSGHGYEHSGQLHLKSPDSDTFAADVSVDDIREQLPEESLFVCLLGCCRVDVARAIERPRMLLITPVQDTVKTYLRRKLRMLRPVSREHFYLYFALNGEEVADSVDPATSFAAIIRRQPESSIEEVARQLRRRSTHVEWRSNLDRWSGTPIGQAKRPFDGFQIMLQLASLVVVCGICGYGAWLWEAEQLAYKNYFQTAGVTCGWVPATINSSCVEEELMGYPFLFEEETREADLILLALEALRRMALQDGPDVALLLAAMKGANGCNLSAEICSSLQKGHKILN